MADKIEKPRKTILVGITGPAASGKGTFRDLLLNKLKHRGFETHFFSMSDEVRREAEKENPQYTREDLRRTATKLKKQFGPSVLAIRALQDIEDAIAKGATPRIVVTEAIRNFHEVEEFRRHIDVEFLLVAVSAPMNSLVDRVLERKRYDENTNVLADRTRVQEMIQNEEREDLAYGHQIERCVKAADIIILNDGELDDLKKQVDGFVEKYILPRLD
jgi:dephospho-CoA kinase